MSDQHRCDHPGCGASFSSRSALYQHKISVHTGDRYGCACGSSWSYPASFYTHRRQQYEEGGQHSWSYTRVHEEASTSSTPDRSATGSGSRNRGPQPFYGYSAADADAAVRQLERIRLGQAIKDVQEKIKEENKKC